MDQECGVPRRLDEEIGLRHSDTGQPIEHIKQPEEAACEN